MRDNALKYTYNDMNLKLENDNQVYIAVADVPVESLLMEQIEWQHIGMLRKKIYRIALIGEKK